MLQFPRLVVVYALLAAPAATQSVTTNGIAVTPDGSTLLVVNQDNDSVSFVDRMSGTLLAEVPVGVKPRHIAITADGAKAYVTNSRGNVPLDRTFLNFTGFEVFGTVSVIDVAGQAVTKTILEVGVEPHGVVIAPSGQWAAVTGFRSADVTFLDTAADAVMFAYQYPRNMGNPPAGMTSADLDADGDRIADLEYPRGMSLTTDGQKLFVAHTKSPWISVLDIATDATGMAVGASLSSKIHIDVYDNEDTAGNPIRVQTVKSQGDPRWLEEVTLDPSGTIAVVPHVLLNAQFDTTFDFGSTPAFANRVYPALTFIDAMNESFEWRNDGSDPSDESSRLQHELSQSNNPTSFVAFGTANRGSGNYRVSLMADSAPVQGTTPVLQVRGAVGGTIGILALGTTELDLPVLDAHLYTLPVVVVPFVCGGAAGAAGAGSADIPIPVGTAAALAGSEVILQAAALDAGAPYGLAVSNGLKAVLGPDGTQTPDDAFPYRIAQPSRIAFTTSGNGAVLLNRASEDFVIHYNDLSDPSKDVEHYGMWPRRDIPRPEIAGLDDPSRMVGDTPVAMLLIEDPDTPEEDAFLYIANEVSRDLSRLKVDFETCSVTSLGDRIPLVTNDHFTDSQRRGKEIFTDGSRSQTTGNFNNSCEGCHFEGNDDGTVWDRPAGPRATNQLHGGAFATGYMLWKSGRLNLGETGPMFGGENGGTGVFTDDEQDALTAYHEMVPVPLNPNTHNGHLSALAALGRDLYHGRNDTGLNPTLRHAACNECHPDIDIDAVPPLELMYTKDLIAIMDPALPPTEQDPCVVLAENLIGNAFKDVNSGVNVDLVNNATGDPIPDGIPDVDRNLDGIPDLESYDPLHADLDDGFFRDDINSDLCFIGETNQKFFTRGAAKFGIPTKLGAFSTGPYFHDHAVQSLRSTVDPGSQAWPTLGKLQNTEHDVRGTLVQLDLVSTDVNGDIEAILAFIQSL